MDEQIKRLMAEYEYWQGQVNACIAAQVPSATRTAVRIAVMSQRALFAAIRKRFRFGAG